MTTETEGAPHPQDHVMRRESEITRQHSDSLLTPERARRINDRFDIELYAGKHGWSRAQAQEFAGKHLGTLTTDKEFEGAAAVIDDMQPGDVLLLENYGFDEHPPEPMQVEAVLGAATLEKRTELEEILKEARAGLEEARRSREINAWEYAMHLASMKGIDIRYADLGASDELALRGGGNDRHLAELLRSTDEDDRALAKQINAQREHSVAKTACEWALDRLETAEHSITDDTRKQKIVILYGAGHKDGIKQECDEIGLDLKVIDLESTDSYSERLFEGLNSSLERTRGVGRVATADKRPNTSAASHSVAERLSARQGQAFKRSRSGFGGRSERRF